MSDNKTFKLNILASDRPFYNGPCEMLVFPGLDGEMGVLPRHEAMVTCDWNYAAVSTGIIEIMPDHVTLLADTVERPEEIDVKRAQAAEDRAKEALRQKQSIKEYYQTQAALNRAISRLKVSGHNTQRRD